MKILVTGSNGFIGKNLVAELKNRGYSEIYECTKETSEDLLRMYCQDVKFIFHLAGTNRPMDKSEFNSVNYGFTEKLITILKEEKNICPILMTSSTQAISPNEYGISKKNAENCLINYQKEYDVNVLIYRLPNVFGKWCKPNYNSVIATFCHNIANNVPIVINDSKTKLNLVYIDDVINEFIANIFDTIESTKIFYEISNTYERELGEIASIIQSFRESRNNYFLPNISDSFVKKLYSTYLSYLPENNFSYELKMNIDNRGSFTEFIKTNSFGQVSVNISKPSVSKGNHWHHTKNEKFLVVSGNGVIRFRNYHSDKIIEYFVSGDKLQVVDVPVGYTHNIENLGDTDMVTIMWANEQFDPENPDTYFEEV